MSPSRTPRRATLALLGAALALPATNAVAQTGSGTVAFTFTNFNGPFSDFFPAPGSPGGGFSNNRGLVNGVLPTETGRVPLIRPGQPEGSLLIGTRTFTEPVTSVSMRYTFYEPGDPGENIISFAARPFTNVALGQDFVLGTLTFKNGDWLGATATGTGDTPSDLGFRITTTSANGSAFNQTIEGRIRMVPHNPAGLGCDTRAAQEAQADWVYIDSPAVVGTMGAFRVFDRGVCQPAGFTSVGTVDVIARFNSLDLVSFANASNGFVTSSVDPLPFGPAVVPEPGTWALVAAGGAALGAWGRRRRRTA